VPHYDLFAPLQEKGSALVSNYLFMLVGFFSFSTFLIAILDLWKHTQRLLPIITEI